MTTWELNIKVNDAGALLLADARRRKGVSAESTKEAAIANENSSLTETFSKNLARVRKEQGLSRAALGRKSGLKANSLYNIEHCLSSARLTTIEKLAQALNIRPDELLKQ